jgi:23S rRNA (adenine2503-C2)-methyltransferase
MNFEQYKTPTGHICIMKGEAGLPLEFLSLGDYGREKNVKADFLGLANEINGVPHGDLLPLEDKWVITISSQYGCSMGCKFCDVPMAGPGKNATIYDLLAQVHNALSLHPEVKTAKRINLHYARMGDPTWNRDVIPSAWLFKETFERKGWGFHPVVSTMMPAANGELFPFLHEWICLKNDFGGNAGLQISVNTTDEKIRNTTMPHAMGLKEIAALMGRMRETPLGRKTALNFALTGAPVDAKYLRQLFDPQYFMCKITPMHNTRAVMENNMMTDGGYDFYYPYKQAEESLKAEGFDVIVFIPSKEEDESRITCGNAVLAYQKLKGQEAQDDREKHTH